MEMAKYILSILRSQLMVMLSWGCSDFRALPNNEGIIFHVKGFKHVGWCKIVYNEGRDLFDIFYLSDEMETLKVENGIYLDMLTTVIDLEIERTKDYENDVRRSLVGLIK